MSKIKEAQYKPRVHVSQPISWSMVAILGDSIAVAVLRTRPGAILLLAILSMRKSIHGFPLLFYTGVRLRLVALRVAGVPLLLQEAHRRVKSG